MALTGGTTDTSYVEAGLQGINRPHDKLSIADIVERVGRTETPLLSKIKTGKKAGNNSHNWLFKKVAEANRTPVAAVSEFTGGSKPTTQRLNNATEIFKEEDWISQSAKDTDTYDKEDVGTKKRDMALALKKTQEQAILGVNRKIITEGAGGTYEYAPLDADPVLAAKMSLIAKPIFRSGDGTNPADASQMAGVFHYIANTGLTQTEINNGSFRDLTGFVGGELGNIKTYDSAGDWTGNSTVIDRKHLSAALRKLTDYGVTASGGAFDLYCGGDLIEAIGDMYADTRRAEMKDTEIGYMVDTVVTQFGKLRLHYHREFNSDNGLDDVILMGNFNYLEKNFLTPVMEDKPSTSQTAELIRYYADMTMSVRNAYAFTGICGLKA